MNDSRDQFVVNMKPVSPVFHTEETVSIGLKKGTQSGNIHSTILDVYVGRQSTQNFPFTSLQCRLHNRTGYNYFSCPKQGPDFLIIEAQKIFKLNSQTQQYIRNLNLVLELCPEKL